MKGNTTSLTIIIYLVLLGAVSELGSQQIKINLGLHHKTPFNGVMMGLVQVFSFGEAISYMALAISYLF